MTRAWKVGERCWILDDDRRARCGKVAEFDKRCGLFRVNNVDSHPGPAWRWRASTAMFATRLEAQIDDAKTVVGVRKGNYGWALYDAQKASRLARAAKRELEKAKKRLAALKARRK